MQKTYIGIDLGGTKTAVVLSKAPPAVLARLEFPTLADQAPELTLQRINEAVRILMTQHRLTEVKIAAIGVSCGSPLDRVRGIIQAPPNLPTWVDVPICRILEREFHAVCRLENDANAGAVAEHRFGAGSGARQMIFLTLGTGLGAGVILDGKLYLGAGGDAGEIGHVRLTATGPVGYGKAGSVEGWSSGGGIAQLARQALADPKHQSSTLAAQAAAGIAVSARDVAQAAHAGDKLARSILNTSGRRLGQSLAILIDLFNPQCIVLGGMAMRMGELLLAPMRRAVRREALPHSLRACSIVTAALGEAIGDVASLCVAMGVEST